MLLSKDHVMYFLKVCASSIFVVDRPKQKKDKALMIGHETSLMVILNPTSKEYVLKATLQFSFNLP